MAHFDFKHGQKLRFLTFTTKHESSKNYFLFYEKFLKFQFFTMSKVKMGHILPKRKNGMTNFFEYSKVSDKLPEN